MSDDEAQLFAAEQGQLPIYLSGAAEIDRNSIVGIPMLACWAFSTAIALEIALTAAKLGAEVRFLWASEKVTRVGITGSWMVGAQNSRNLCETLVKIARQANPHGRFSIQAITPVKGMRSKAIHVESDLSRAAIRSLEWEGSQVGKAILQTPPIASLSSSDDELWPRKWIQASLNSFVSIRSGLAAAIEDSRMTHIFVYNGRFTLERAVLDACKDTGIIGYCYDNAGYDTDFEVCPWSLHDWSLLQQRMKDLWARESSPLAATYARDWFESRILRLDPANARFVAAQKSGQGISLDPEMKLVVFFSSSIDEVAELDFDWSEYFNSQSEALQTLKDVCSEDSSMQLVVRSHPHMRLKSIADQQLWEESIEEISPDLHVEPESEVDSYWLAQRADVVVTYGSTMGVEAAFLGKPVLIMGPSIYDDLGIGRRVSNVSELRAALRAQASIDEESLLAYGLMMRFRGFRFQEVRVEGAEFQVGEASLNSSHPGYCQRLHFLWGSILRKYLTS